MNQHLALSFDCSLKLLEEPHVYNKTSDVLYELDKASLNFLFTHQAIIDTGVFTGIEKEFIDYCASEQILVPANGTVKERSFSLDPQYQSPSPSLRYLLLHITEYCNLSCKHCYYVTGRPTKKHLPLEQISDILEQFQRFQGLIVLISGGEPMMHPDFWRLNKELAGFDLRFELLTNGTLITRENATSLNFHQVQVSLDGLAPAHEFMRGQGSFDRAISGLQFLRDAKKRTAVSSIVYRNNFGDFGEMDELLSSLDINQWLVNGPSEIGHWKEHGADLKVSPETIADYMIRYSRGEGPHVSAFDQVCGSHICTIFADGSIYPCPMITDEASRMGAFPQASLRNAWLQKNSQPFDLKACEGCEHLEECKGGCRFRANEGSNPCGRDPVSCALFQSQKERR